MKIAILTFSCAHNYGAVLQAYALQEQIKKLGHDVYVLDYRPSYLTKEYGLFYSSFDAILSRNPLKMIKKCILEIPFFWTRIRKINGFKRFGAAHLNLMTFKKGDDLHGFDTLIIGSDQVWEKLITGWDDVFWGNGFKCKVITYGASMRFINEQIAKNLAIHLSNYSAISVREYEIYEELKRRDISTTIVLDPTLLAGSGVFKKIASLKYCSKKPYVLIFQLGYRNETRNVAKQIAEEMEAEVIELTYRSNTYYRYKGTLTAVSPEEFVGLFQNASCVLTTSFHGMAFSILYEKPFYVMEMGTVFDNRAKNLLRELGIPERIIHIGETSVDYCAIDYSSVNKKINILQHNSLNFLIKNL